MRIVTNMEHFIDKFLNKYLNKGQQMPPQQQQKSPLVQLNPNAQKTQPMQSSRPVQKTQQPVSGNISRQGRSEAIIGKKRSLD